MFQLQVSEWGQQKELRTSFKKLNTAKEVESVILILDLVTRGTSLNLLYMKVDFLRREDESLKGGQFSLPYPQIQERKQGLGVGEVGRLD